MKKLIPLLSALLLGAPAAASTVSGSGTQPYACTVVGNSSINLVSTGQNQLTANGSGSVYQNGATDYTLGSVTTTGPDANSQTTVTAIGGTLNMSATESAGDTQQISGELSETVTYTISISSSDSVLAAGNYTATTSLTCTAAP